MKPDYIGNELLMSGKQIAARLPEAREKIGTGRWVHIEEVAKLLGITQSQSSLTMTGIALRSFAGVVARRTSAGRVFMFTE